MKCIITLRKGNKIVGASRNWMPDLDEISSMKQNYDEGVITFVGEDGSINFDLDELGEI